MNRFKLLSHSLLILTCLLPFTGCRRTSSDIYDDTKSAGRHFKRSVSALGGKHGDSRQISSEQDFNGGDMYASQDMDFTPLTDENGRPMFSTENAPQARTSPGDAGSGIPGIEGFADPDNDPRLAKIFQHIHFDYNSNLVRGDENIFIIKNIAETMKKQSNMYLFIEGHCDERGAQAYNLALGSRRANAVRNSLVQEGVDPEHIFTVSYGKERPLVMGTDDTSWRLNRRAQFKIFEK